MSEKPQNSTDAGQEFLWREYQSYDMPDEDADHITQENEILLKYLAERKSAQQTSRREREKLQPIIEDRLKMGLDIQNEQEYQTFMNMVKVLHPHAKFPTFQDIQTFLQNHESIVF